MTDEQRFTDLKLTHKVMRQLMKAFTTLEKLAVTSPDLARMAMVAIQKFIDQQPKDPTETTALALALRTSQAFADAFKLLTDLTQAEPTLALPMFALLKQHAATIPDTTPLTPKDN